MPPSVYFKIINRFNFQFETRNIALIRDVGVVEVKVNKVPVFTIEQGLHVTSCLNAPSTRKQLSSLMAFDLGKGWRGYIST